MTTGEFQTYFIVETDEQGILIIETAAQDRLMNVYMLGKGYDSMQATAHVGYLLICGDGNAASQRASRAGASATSRNGITPAQTGKA